MEQAAKLERTVVLSDQQWEERFGVCASEEEIALEEELRRMPCGEIGPRVRDEMIYAQVAFRGRTAEEVAGEFGLSPRTVRNIVRSTMTQVAIRQAAYERMTLGELYDEEERLEDLAQRAMAVWRSSFRPARKVRTTEPKGRKISTTTYRERLGQPRSLEIANRADVQLLHLRPQLEQRTQAALAEAERLARVRVRTVPARTRRRISMSGKTLRLPPIVRARPISDLPAAYNCSLQASRQGQCLVGIPPPDS